MSEQEKLADLLYKYFGLYTFKRSKDAAEAILAADYRPAAAVMAETVAACRDAAHDAIHDAVTEASECSRIKSEVDGAIRALAPAGKG